MALSVEGIGGAETTVDVIAVMVIALVVGFIVYEVANFLESTSGLLLALGAGALSLFLLL